MKPILYSPTETSFKTNGIGILSDAISCDITQELNGRYELTAKYPVDGLHFSSIQQRSIIVAKVDPVSEIQPFRVYRITKPSSGIVTIMARHIVYDLAGHPVSPFAAQSAVTALSGLKSNAVTDHPFTFTTDKTNSGDFSVAVPSATWSLLGSAKGAILDAFGGEYEFDRYAVNLWNQRGMDRGVSIRYGKNLTSLEQDENCANCYTGVMPYWVDRSTKAVTMLTGKVVAGEGNFDHTKILPIDLTAEFETAPTEDALAAAARSYMIKNKICEPVVSLKVEFIQLEQTAEYKGMALLERVLLGDMVAVEFEQIGVSSKARAVAIDYNAILERYNSVTLGSVKANIADNIVRQNKEISSRPNKSEMQLAIESLTSSILGASGGSVRFLDTNGDKIPDTLYIADNPDPAQARKVWRFNYEGWGASTNGYNGPFVMGATFNDGIVADFITVGTLYGLLFKAGMIESLDGTIKIDLSGGQQAKFNAGIEANDLSLKPQGATNYTFRAISYENKYQEEKIPATKMYMEGFDGNKIFSVDHNFLVDEDGTNYRIGQTYVGCYFGTKGKAEIVSGESSSELVLLSNTGSFFNLSTAGDDVVWLNIPSGHHRLSWKDNGDGTFTLIGQ